MQTKLRDRIKRNLRECYIKDENSKEPTFLSDVYHFLPKEEYAHILRAYSITEEELKDIIYEMGQASKSHQRPKNEA